MQAMSNGVSIYLVMVNLILDRQVGCRKIQNTQDARQISQMKPPFEKTVGISPRDWRNNKSYKFHLTRLRLYHRVGEYCERLCGALPPHKVTIRNPSVT